MNHLVSKQEANSLCVCAKHRKLLKQWHLINYDADDRGWKNTFWCFNPFGTKYHLVAQMEPFLKPLDFSPSTWQKTRGNRSDGGGEELKGGWTNHLSHSNWPDSKTLTLASAANSRPLFSRCRFKIWQQWNMNKNSCVRHRKTAQAAGYKMTRRESSIRFYLSHSYLGDAFSDQLSSAPCRPFKPSHRGCGSSGSATVVSSLWIRTFLPGIRLLHL